MVEKKRLVLADEMGLGKTVQAIGCLNALPSIQSALIVCPKSMMHTWESELKKWLTRPMKVGLIESKVAIPADCDVLIVNYDMVWRRKSELVEREPFGALICDEAHYLKNPTAQRTKGVLGDLLKAREKRVTMQQREIAAEHVWLLTGSPVLNHPIELWPLLRAVDPEARVAPRTFSFYAFRNRYCDPKENAGGFMDYSGVSHVKELRALLARSGLFLRRTKADVLTQLPPKRRELLLYDDPGAVGAARSACTRPSAAISHDTRPPTSPRVHPAHQQ